MENLFPSFQNKSNKKSEAKSLVVRELTHSLSDSVMGLPGLFRFISAERTYIRENDLLGKTVVIDGLNVLNSLVRACGWHARRARVSGE